MTLLPPGIKGLMASNRLENAETELIEEDGKMLR